ncbi:MAG: IS4 family transposase [Bacteriovoracales bacterium]|nr:IS4 family transposase [Bacteriovoracales bacterium]
MCFQYSQRFVQNEFLNLTLGDKRLSKRVINIALSIIKQPDSSIPVALNGEKKSIKGVYRFFQNKKINDQSILETHYFNTIERIKKTKGTIILISDSTYINPAKSRTMPGLRKLGCPAGEKNFMTQGIRVHYTLAYDLKNNEILGITDILILDDKKKDSEALPIRTEIDVWILSIRNTIEKLQILKKSEEVLSRCIVVGDREADFFDFLHELKDLKIKFIIRSKYNRSVEYQNAYEIKTKKISDLKKDAVLHGRPYKVLVYSNQKEREAILQRSVLINTPIFAPGRHPRKDPVDLSVVFVDEINGPYLKEERVSWRILSNLQSHSEEDTYFIINLYKKRWLIEELNKCAKTGLSLEKRQFTRTEYFRPFIAMTFVLAQTFLKMREKTKKKDKSIRDHEIFSSLEVSFMAKKLNVSKSHISYKEAYHFIAKLGGYIDSKNSPGWQSIWIGGKKFSLLIEGYQEAFT